ncbi:MAG TPA: hypothetical protein VEG39_01880 [Clostridia bacterium]|nr:hypothetical protein [Clostridia bacterium]
MDRIPVECIVTMNHQEITPIKVRYENNDERVVIKIDRILKRDKKSTMPYMDHPEKQSIHINVKLSYQKQGSLSL